MPSAHESRRNLASQDTGERERSRSSQRTLIPDRSPITAAHLPPSNKHVASEPGRTIYQRLHMDRLLLPRDYRPLFPLYISRFIGYRPPTQTPSGSPAPPSLHAPLPFPPFTYLHHIPLKTEIYIFALLGSFTSILLIEAIMATHTAFRDLYNSPIIITSFGASAVLLFGVIESPLSQPRNFIGGHFTAALVGVCLTKLFRLGDGTRYLSDLENHRFEGKSFGNGGLAVGLSVLAMLMLGDVHPP
jgi:hypothetical protein